MRNSLIGVQIEYEDYIDNIEIPENRIRIKGIILDKVIALKYQNNKFLWIFNIITTYPVTYYLVQPAKAEGTILIEPFNIITVIDSLI